MTKSSRSSLCSLVDRVANGGIKGSDVRVIENHPDRKVDICGVDNHQISAILLVTVGGVTITITGEVTVIMHQHVCHGKNKPIHSSPQIELHKSIVDDCSIKFRCVQHIATLDKHKTPMSI